MNFINILNLLLITLTLCSCGSKGEFQLTKVHSASISESDSVHIIAPKSGVVLKNEQILLLSSRTKVVLLDPNTGKLSSYLSIDSIITDSIYTFLKRNLPNYRFNDEKFYKGSYTIKIDQLSIDQNYLYLGLTTQFFINAKYQGEPIIFFPFFSVILKYDLDTKKNVDKILIPEFPKTELSNQDKGGGNYAASEDGMYVKNDTIYVKNVHQPVNDTCRFLYRLTKNSNGDYIKKLINLTSDTKKIRGNVNLNTFSFNDLNDGMNNCGLLCSDGKDIYCVTNETKYKGVIIDSSSVIRSFKVFDENEIIIAKGNVKNGDLSLELYNRDSTRTLIPSSGSEKLYLFNNRIYCISRIKDSYHILTYEIN